MQEHFPQVGTSGFIKKHIHFINYTQICTSKITKWILGTETIFWL